MSVSSACFLSMYVSCSRSLPPLDSRLSFLVTVGSHGVVPCRYLVGILFLFHIDIWYPVLVPHRQLEFCCMSFPSADSRYHIIVPYRHQSLCCSRSISAVGVLFSWRMAVTLLCLLGGTASMLGRVVTSFAVLCMVQDVNDDNGTSHANGADSVTVSTGRERKEAEYADRPTFLQKYGVYCDVYIYTIFPTSLTS